MLSPRRLRKCRQAKADRAMEALNQVEIFAKADIQNGLTDKAYAMPSEWIVEIAKIVRELKEKNKCQQ